MLYINKKSFWFSTTNISRKVDMLSNMHLMIKSCNFVPEL